MLENKIEHKTQNKLKTKHLILILFTLATFSAFGSHKVYIIHGWGNPKSIMNKIHKDVKKAGYASENYAYPGLMVELDSIGKLLYTDIKTQDFDSVSFVTHSMGALVFRNMLKYAGLDPDFPEIYRIVMISPPNQGADIADFFKDNEKWKDVLGPNVQKMETDSLSYANQLPVPIDCEIGVVIGKRGKRKGYNPWINGDNDGLIKPEHTLLGNEQDTITLKLNHGALTQRKKSRKRIMYFLKSGSFDKVKK